MVQASSPSSSSTVCVDRPCIGRHRTTRAGEDAYSQLLHPDCSRATFKHVVMEWPFKPWKAAAVMNNTASQLYHVSCLATQGSPSRRPHQSTAAIMKQARACFATCNEFRSVSRGSPQARHIAQRRRRRRVTRKPCGRATHIPWGVSIRLMHMVAPQERDWV